MTSGSDLRQGRPFGGLMPTVLVAARRLVPHPGLWLAVGGVMALNLGWIGLDLRLALAPNSVLVLAVVILAVPLVLAYRELRGGAADPLFDALCRMLVVVLFAAFLTQNVNLFSHLMMTLKQPLADARLRGWDEALGFDWNAYVAAVAAWPWSRAVLLFAYDRLIPLGVAAILASAVFARRHDRVDEVAFLVLASGLVAVTLAGFFPAEGAWTTLAKDETLRLLGGQPGPGWFPQFAALRSDAPLVLHIGELAGIATFPSFHACLAIIIMWCSRGRWFTALPGLAAGLAILAATPVYGEHYGVDLLGGAVVMACAILLWRRLGPRLSKL